MTGPFQECQVRLHRDALSTSWGFRLQGGKDFKTPLTVQRVFVGSPADGELHRGDVIGTVQNYDATNMMHKQAQDLIKQAGGSLSLRVKRSLQTRARSAPPAPTPQHQGYRAQPGFQPASAAAPSAGSSMYGFVPKPQPQYGGGGGGAPREFGQSYGGQPGRRGPGGAPPNMLSRVNQSLNQALWQTNPEDDPDYESKSINQLQQMFTQPAQHQQHDSDDVDDYKTVNQLKSMFSKPASGTYAHTPQRKWVKPSVIPGTPRTLLEPGWTPKSLGGGRDYTGSLPRHRPQPSTPPAAFTQQQFPEQQFPEHHQDTYRPQPKPSYQQQHAPHEDYQPSWKGSLKSSGGPKPWEMREQEQLVEAEHHQQPAPAPAAPAAEVPVHQPRVQNVHYGPGASGPEYQQHSAANHGDSDSARVAHLQYNTPIGLYSKQNVEKVLHSQTGGQPGEGTMQVTGPGNKPFNPAQSDVYRMVLEEDERRKPGGHQQRQQPQQQQQQPQQQQQQQQQQPQHPQSARYVDQGPGQEMHYHGYMDHSHQSPSMHALESKVDDYMGTSDF